MAQVEGVTPAKLSEISEEIGKSVVSATIDVGGQLLLNTRDGAVIMAGMVGTGGADTASVDESVTLSFSTPALTWTCTHNLGHRFVDVTTYAPDGSVIVGDVQYVNDNTCTVRWYFPTAGTAYIQR
jgi:hypothetical protein